MGNFSSDEEDKRTKMKSVLKPNKKAESFRSAISAMAT